MSTTVADPVEQKLTLPPTIESSPAPVASAVELHESEIAARAFELYCERGREDGHDLEDWLQAERELKRGHELTE